MSIPNWPNVPKPSQSLAFSLRVRGLSWSIIIVIIYSIADGPFHPRPWSSPKTGWSREKFTMIQTSTEKIDRGSVKQLCNRWRCFLLAMVLLSSHAPLSGSVWVSGFVLSHKTLQLPRVVMDARISDSIHFPPDGKIWSRQFLDFFTDGGNMKTAAKDPSVWQSPGIRTRYPCPFCNYLELKNKQHRNRK